MPLTILINKRLTRAFSEYKAIAQSTGLPIHDIVEAACAVDTNETQSNPSLKKPVYYDLQTNDLFKAASKKNYQRTEIPVDKQYIEKKPVVIIGGKQGYSMQDAGITLDTLIDDYDYADSDAIYAMEFFDNIRFTQNDFKNSSLMTEIKSAIKANSYNGYEDLIRDVQNLTRLLQFW
jgi:hypothetical protein